MPISRAVSLCQDTLAESGANYASKTYFSTEIRDVNSFAKK